MIAADEQAGWPEMLPTGMAPQQRWLGPPPEMLWPPLNPGRWGEAHAAAAACRQRRCIMTARRCSGPGARQLPCPILTKSICWLPGPSQRPLMAYLTRNICRESGSRLQGPRTRTGRPLKMRRVTRRASRSSTVASACISTKPCRFTPYMPLHRCTFGRTGVSTTCVC